MTCACTSFFSYARTSFSSYVGVGRWIPLELVVSGRVGVDYLPIMGLESLGKR